MMGEVGVLSKLKSLAGDERAQDLVEDALLACYVALSVMATFPDFAEGMTGMFQHLRSAVARIQ